MNLVQTNLLREVAAEVKAKGGPAQFKAHALKNLELRTVLKESHCSPILDLVFNSLASEHRNLFASVGKDQATIYDDEHMGDFLGVVVHYVNGPSAHHKGGDLTCCAWVQMAGITRHELGDTCLAVSGPEGVIQVMSVVEARVVAMLLGHRGEVVDLRGCAGVPGLLLSLGADGGVRLWDVMRGSCLGEVASDATTLEVHPDGSCFFTAHRGGRICSWRLDLELHTDTDIDTDTDQGQRQGRDGARACSAPLAANITHPTKAPSSEPSPDCAPSRTAPQALATGVVDVRTAAPTSAPSPGAPTASCGQLHTTNAPATPPSDPALLRLRRSQRQALALRAGRLPVSEPLQLPGTALGDYVDCLRCMAVAPEVGEGTGPAEPRGLLAAKSSDGRLGVWDLDLGQQLLSLRVPGTHPPAGAGGPGGAVARGTRCRFSVTRDGAFICVGNASGDVYVYDTSSGARAAHYSASKMRGPARAAALSEDGRHLLTVHGNGYILRYEYIRKQGKEGTKGANADEDAAAANVAADDVVVGGSGGCGGGGAAAGPTSSREVSPDPPGSHADDDEASAPPPPPAGPAGLPPKRPRALSCAGGMDGDESDGASDGRRVWKRAVGPEGGGD